MDRLWTPWRYQYLSHPPAPGECIFCRKPGQPDQEALILHRAQWNYVLLNLFPYTNGHLMIAPFRHVPTLEQLPDDDLHELIRLTRHAEALLRRVYSAPGINAGMNIGESAGAGVAGHIHMHVLPRWPGDSNFMATLGETRVIPEELSVTWKRLREAW